MIYKQTSETFENYYVLIIIFNKYLQLEGVN